jgi:arsenite methyltransferase
MRGLYDDLCECWAADEPMRPGGLQLTERALAVCSFPSGSRLLDIGCGTGITVEYLARRNGYAAVGMYPSAVLLAKGLGRNPRLPLVCSAGESLPLAEASRDGVFLECSLSVCADPDRVLAECGRILKKGGRLVVSDVYRRDPCDRPESPAGLSAGCFSGAFDRDGLCGTLSALGFRVLLWEDHTEALKYFAARLILSGGPAASLRGGAFHACAGEGAARREGRPGYFLLIAEWTCEDRRQRG